MRLPPDIEAKVLATPGAVVRGRKPIGELPALPSGLSEKAFMAEVIRCAKMLGWLTYHTHDSRRSAGGFPDLVLVREKVIYAELKREGENPTSLQQMWLNRLREAGQTAYLWRPADWPAIQTILGRRP